VAVERSNKCKRSRKTLVALAAVVRAASGAGPQEQSVLVQLLIKVSLAVYGGLLHGAIL
jgi:hypothetical protein